MNAPSPAPVPPLLAAARRRHPDVDLVLLDEQRGPLPEPVADTTLSRVAGNVAATAAALAGEDAFEPVRFGYGPAPGTVVARSRLSARGGDGGAVLAGLRALLEQEGWQVRRLEGEVARVVACCDGQRLRASYASGSGFLLVELASSPVHVGDERARTLAGRS